MPAKPYLLTGPAKTDIRSIRAFLRAQSPQASITVTAELHDAMRKLGEMPGMGHPRPELAPEHLRFWHVHQYLIVYRPETVPIQILRVLHGKRDVGTILGTK